MKRSRISKALPRNITALLSAGRISAFGYHRIENYPPYDKLEGAVCFAKELS